MHTHTHWHWGLIVPHSHIKWRTKHTTSTTEHDTLKQMHLQCPHLLIHAYTNRISDSQDEYILFTNYVLTELQHAGGWRPSSPPNYHARQWDLIGGVQLQWVILREHRLQTRVLSIPRKSAAPSRSGHFSKHIALGVHVWDESLLGRYPSMTGLGELKMAFTPEDWLISPSPNLERWPFYKWEYVCVVYGFLKGIKTVHRHTQTYTDRSEAFELLNTPLFLFSSTHI